MINYIYQLINPNLISIKFTEIEFTKQVLIRPRYMSICHADQRYFLGLRDPKILKKKLPMALIHECWGEVLIDKANIFEVGEKVVLIPNISNNKENFLYENYDKHSSFLSSGQDGFMREMINLTHDQVVSFKDIDDKIVAITEFVSVAVHAVTRFNIVAHIRRNRIGIWGDGSLAYVVACVLNSLYPSCDLCVIGHNESKLEQFSFVKENYLAHELPNDFEVDHAFECCGGEGSYYAMIDIIKSINPQGTIILMGVSENEVSIDTRTTLEKGLVLLGCSRSGRKDFEQALELMKNINFQNRLTAIIYEASPVRTIEDIYQVFAIDRNTKFKTVFRWEI